MAKKEKRYQVATYGKKYEIQDMKHNIQLAICRNFGVAYQIADILNRSRKDIAIPENPHIYQHLR